MRSVLLRIALTTAVCGAFLTSALAADSYTLGTISVDLAAVGIRLFGRHAVESLDAHGGQLRAAHSSLGGLHITLLLPTELFPFAIGVSLPGAQRRIVRNQP